jgi:hypothetical protein
VWGRLSAADSPLDCKRRSTPINVTDDRDWEDVAGEFMGAERERRRISRRILRSYEGRRERGASTNSHLPFGLKKVGDRLEPHPDHAWIIFDLDAKFLAGEGQMPLAFWLRAVSGGKIGSRRGIRKLLLNDAFVNAGLRSAETNAALQARCRFLAASYGNPAPHPSALTGIVACGRCLARGAPMNRALMSATCQKTNNTGGIICRFRGHSNFVVTVDLIEPLFVKFLERWQAPSTIERWAVEPTESEHAEYPSAEPATVAIRSA